ncbi:DNA polymerase IV [Streptomyces sp. 549]|uniref:DNA polymerase IV n=1 Tax=Streptomyces sp. 549 TaxID=3049076 RepID=UPI0024C3C6B5|nr:DNA polymerase IV [Streptomyces sp. 549]MDK1474466.1 DNA polymerase IV [Streptomyces sp. 549]
MRRAPSILHLDMDAFFAAVEQAAKPSLRGKPVVVGGLGPRGVVATASYEARRFGVHSAMPTAQARRRCPNAAYLVPRFAFYREISTAVMALLAGLSPLVEPLSLDEAFVDLEAGGLPADTDSDTMRQLGERLRADILATTGLSGSVGLAGSKMLAKIASEQAKPDGLVLIEPGTERELLAPQPVRILPGVGPATADTLRRAGITTVGEAALAGEAELLRLLGRAHGSALHTMASGIDSRPVVGDRESKSVSVEDTYDTDVTDRTRIQQEITRLADRCAERLRGAGRSGRTVVIKVRRYDFATLTRSETLRGPTDDSGVIREAAQRLLEAVDTTEGVRLLGVGVSGLADFTQEDLFAQTARGAADTGPANGLEPAAAPTVPERRSAGAFLPGKDVHHAVHGPGWVQGSGVGRVTVRFEQPDSAPGRVRTFAADDPDLRPSEPLPLVRVARTPAGDDPPADGCAGQSSSRPATLPKPASSSRGGGSPSDGTARP